MTTQAELSLVDLTGNVKNREMEVFNKQYACRFKLVPGR
jgi:hypothetical protein